MPIGWIVFFFILGLIFGLVADRNAWFLLLLPVLLMLETWYKENLHAYNVVLPILTMLATAIGIVIGHLIILRRVDRPPA